MFRKRQPNRHVSQRLPLDIANLVCDKTRYARRQLVLFAGLSFITYEAMAHGGPPSSLSAVAWDLLAAASTLALFGYAIAWIDKHKKISAVIGAATFAIFTYLAYRAGRYDFDSFTSNICGATLGLGLLLVAVGCGLSSPVKRESTA